jgi:HEAT repeat protein
MTRLPAKNWFCFFLARTLGYMADPRSVDALIAALDTSPSEAAGGRPLPTGPGVLFLHNDLTPCWRAAVAWALGRLGDHRAILVLLKIVGDLDNAPDTRHSAAVAAGCLATVADTASLRAVADGYPEVSTRKALLAACARLAP